MSVIVSVILSLDVAALGRGEPPFYGGFGAASGNRTPDNLITSERLRTMHIPEFTGLQAS